MAYLHNGKTIRVGKIWSDGTYKHPYNWASSYTDQNKVDFGITFEADADTSFDSQFYFSKDIPRILGDTLWVDDDGVAIVDETTGNQGVTLGLKSNWIARTKETANSTLKSTDWLVIRNAEDSSKTIPSAISTFRSAVRTATATIETAINNCANLDAFKLLFVTPVDSDGVPTGKAPINNFPDNI